MKIKIITVILLLLIAVSAFCQSNNKVSDYEMDMASPLEQKIENYHDYKVMQDVYQSINDSIDETQDRLNRIEQKLKAKKEEKEEKETEQAPPK